MLETALVILALLIVPFLYVIITDHLFRRKMLKEARLREEIREEYAADLRKERLMRAAYERSLGLPTWDDRELEKALWARAYQDPEDPAWEILSVIYSESSFEDWVYER